MRYIRITFILVILLSEDSFGQVKYLASHDKSSYALLLARTYGPNKNKSSGFSAATGNRYVEIGITYLKSTVYYGEYNDQTTNVSGAIPSLEFFYERPEVPLIVGIGVSYSALRGENYHVPLRHVIFSPSASYKLIADPASRFNILPEIGLSQMVVFGSGKAPDTVVSLRVITVVSIVSKLTLFGAAEHARSGNEGGNGIYLGILIK